MMTKAEAKITADFLDQLGDRFGNDGCNDCWLDDTPENRAVALAAEKDCPGYRDEGDDEPRMSGGQIITNNLLLVLWLRKRLLETHGLREERES